MLFPGLFYGFAVVLISFKLFFFRVDIPAEVSTKLINLWNICPPLGYFKRERWRLWVTIDILELSKFFLMFAFSSDRSDTNSCRI